MHRLHTSATAGRSGVQKNLGEVSQVSTQLPVTERGVGYFQFSETV